MKNWLKRHGIAGDVAFVRLLYNTPSDKLIAQIQHNPKTKPLSRLYMRHKSQRTYKMIGNPEKNISYDTPVISQSNPRLYFNVWKFEKKGYWWEGINSVNLKNGKVSTICTESDFTWPDPYRRAWIRELIDITEDERSILCIIGYERSDETDLKNWKVEYWLCDFELRTLGIRKITELFGAFV